MPREIKFRAALKDYSHHKQITLYKVAGIDFAREIAELRFYDYDGHPYRVEKLFSDITLMQYTGLKDKNGMEIYEGDIVRTSFEDVGEIFFDIDKFYYVIGIKGKWQSVLRKSDQDRFEVIGNKYENPELLEKIG